MISSQLSNADDRGLYTTYLSYCCTINVFRFSLCSKNRTRNTKIKMYTGLVLQREHMLFNNYLITSVSHKAHSHRISEISFYFIDNLILTSVSFCALSSSSCDVPAPQISIQLCCCDEII